MLSLSSNPEVGTPLSQVLEDAFRGAATGFFDGVREVTPPDEDKYQFLEGETWASVLGFTSSDVRGSLVVNMAKEAVMKSLPPEVTASYSSDPESPRYHAMLNDWCGEISNQICGRAKNRVASYGPLISLSTPISLLARGIVWGPSSATHVFRHFFETDFGRVLSIASLTIEKDHFVEPIQGANPAEEGEMMLF